MGRGSTHGEGGGALERALFDGFSKYVRDYFMTILTKITHSQMDTKLPFRERDPLPYETDCHVEVHRASLLHWPLEGDCRAAQIRWCRAAVNCPAAVAAPLTRDIPYSRDGKGCLKGTCYRGLWPPSKKHDSGKLT